MLRLVSGTTLTEALAVTGSLPNKTLWLHHVALKLLEVCQKSLYTAFIVNSPCRVSGNFKTPPIHYPQYIGCSALLARLVIAANPPLLASLSKRYHGVTCHVQGCDMWVSIMSTATDDKD